MISDYRFQIVEHNGIPCLHVLIDGDNGETYITYIPIDDLQEAIGRVEIAPGLIEFPEGEKEMYDWQKAIDNALEAQRAQGMKTSTQLTLGELILKLEAVEDKNKLVIFNDRYFPVDIDSWRGSYCELALEYAETGDKLSVEELLKKLKGVNGATLYGYKGGEFLMGKTTPVWVAQYGESSGFTRDGDIWTQAVVDIAQNEQAVIIETLNIEY